MSWSLIHILFRSIIQSILRFLLLSIITTSFVSISNPIQLLPTPRPMFFLPSFFLNSFIGKFQVCTVIHTSLLIYVPLSQTTSSNNSNENLDKKVDDCLRKLLTSKCPSWRLHSRCLLLLDDLSNALYHRFEHLRGIEYLKESITCRRQCSNLCPIGNPNRFVFLDNFVAAIKIRFWAIRKNGGFGGMRSSHVTVKHFLSSLHVLHPNRSFSLNKLATAVNRSLFFKQLGKMDDFGGGDHLSPSSTCLSDLRLTGIQIVRLLSSNLATARIVITFRRLLEAEIMTWMCGWWCRWRIELDWRRIWGTLQLLYKL